MTATALDMITDSFQKIGVFAPGETIDAASAQTALNILNDMIDSWSNEALTCYAILEQHAPLVVGQSAYTIGPGGNFNMTRPLRILDSQGSAYILDTNGNKYLMTIVPQDIWNSTTQGNIDSNFPDTLFYDPQFPLGIINIFPSPTIVYTMYWDSYLQLSEFPTLTAPLSLPPGYRKAIQDCLAIEMYPYFASQATALTPLLIEIASKSKGNVKRTNIRENVAQYDPEIVSGNRSNWNIYTNNYNR